MTTALQPGVAFEAFRQDDVTVATEGTPFALPPKSCLLAWQVDVDTAPVTLDIGLEVSMFLEGPYTEIADMDEADLVSDSYFATLTNKTAARFGRINVTGISASTDITVTVIAKVDA